MKNTLTSAIAVMGLIALSGCDLEVMAESDRYREDFHYSYALKSGGKLSLESFNGSVEVTSWDQEMIEISGTKYASRKEVLNSIKIDIQNTADSVIVRAIRPAGMNIGSLGAKFIVKVPRKVELERINSSNGSMRVENVEGPARLRTSNGSVRVSNLRGPLEVRTSNAPVEVDHLDGSADLKSSNGTIRALDVKGALAATTSNAGIRAHLREPEPSRPVRAETSNGSVDLTLDRNEKNDVYATTSNAGITVRMPSGVNADLRANTSNSSVQTDFEVTTSFTGKISKSHLEGKIGSGGNSRIELSTSNGGIQIQKL